MAAIHRGRLTRDGRPLVTMAAATSGRGPSQCPVESNRCVPAARRIVEIATETDPAATAWKLVPREGRYVAPKDKRGSRWYLHATVRTMAHFVDALTGVDGTALDRYFTTHWRYPELLDQRPLGEEADQQ